MNSTRKISAGKVIGSGGFGCVFKPALKCNNKKNRTKGISKLSKTNESIKEFKIIKNIQSIIDKINNNKKYFLISDISMCQPDKISVNDFENINSCNMISETTLSNFNKNIKNYKILNMPDGGKSLNFTIENNTIEFNKINNLLINLLGKAIIPMNNLNLFHNDIKSENILYKNYNLKIIDFGEYFKFKKNIIPDVLKNRKILYNSPFSRILFNNFFINNFNKLIEKINIQKYSDKELFTIIFKIVYKLYSHFIDKYNGTGHEEFLSQYVFKILIKNNPNNYFNFLPESLKQEPKSCLKIFIVLYCSEVFHKYFNKNVKKFEVEKYYSEIYIKNVDIYGFISCYIDYLFYNNFKLSNNISLILLEFCFSRKFAAKAIDKKLLIEKLNSL